MRKRRRELSKEMKAVKAVEMYVQGHTQIEIARIFDVAACTVSGWIADVRIQWAEQRAVGGEHLVNMELAKLDAVEKNAWQQFNKSKKTRRKVTIKSSDDSVERTETIEEGLGDPRYLALVTKAIEQRCKLLGIVKDTEAKGNVDHETVRKARQLMAEAYKDGGGVN